MSFFDEEKKKAMTEKPVEGSTKPARKIPCVDTIAKIQLMNTLGSWIKKRKKEVLKLKGVIDEEWAQKYELVIKKVEEALEAIKAAPVCE